MTAVAAPHVGIVGGGFSGAMVAVQLACRAVGSLRITVVEPRPALGAGLAYGTDDPALRINVPAARMSAYADEPQHFAGWLASSGELPNDPAASWAEGLEFPRRAVFGRYIAALAAAAARTPGVVLRHARTRAVAAEPVAGGYALRLETGETVHLDCLVLATTHPPPSIPRQLADAIAAGAPVIADPWQPGALDRVAPEARVLILGTGLTMADVVASLAERGHRGTVHAVSRRGLLSRGHDFSGATFALGAAAGAPATARQLVRAIRLDVAAARRAGIPWQAVLDAVRTAAPELWSALDVPEQARLLRHVRPFWDVHRFRVAPQLAATIARMRAAGRFTAQAASLAGVEWDGGVLSATLQPRFRADREVVVVDTVIVTTGPAHASVIGGNPLLASLQAQGLIRADPLSLGVAVDAASRAIGSDGVARPGLLVAGPLARARFGELMGLPQVAEHAERVAEAISRSLLAPAPAHAACLMPAGA